MDGREGDVNRSLQRKLSVWLSGVILGIAAVAGILSFAGAFYEANELQDDQLRQIAALFNRHNLPVTGPGRLAEPIADSDSRVIVQTLTDRRSQYATDKGFLLPTDIPDGMQTLTAEGEPWRIFVRTLASGSRIAVGQQTAVRDEIARDSALRTVMPLIILVPLLLLVAGLLIKQMFKPVKKLAADLDRRPEHDLQALNEANLPAEILPFVVAINRLLSRVENAIALQRRFVANAAHELRSPLTALSLQAESLEAVAMPEPARERLGFLKTGIQRARALLEQMLALARVQDASAHAQPASVSVSRVMRQVLEDMMPLAQEKSLDLGVVEDADISVRLREIDLHTLIRNIVDNAIRYTPPGGRVDISVMAGKDQVVLKVDDTGPGIPAPEREQVFDPFYRVLDNNQVGSGLGLSIVKAIIDRNGGSVALSEPAHFSGLSVIVRLRKT